MIESLAKWIAEEPPDSVVLECRHCGTSVDRAGAACPTCRSRDIARYEF